MVSSSGFTKGAIETAEDFNIELYTLENLTENDIKNWIIIKSYNAFKSIREVKVTKVCAKLLGVSPKPVEKSFIITGEHRNGIYTKDFMENFIDTNIPGKVIFLGQMDVSNLTLFLVIKFNGAIYVTGEKIYKLNHIHFQVEHTFIEIDSSLELNKYSENNTKQKLLETATVFSERGDIFSLIRKNNSNIIEIMTNKEDQFVVVDKFDCTKIDGKLSIQITKEAILVKDKIEVKKVKLN